MQGQRGRLTGRAEIRMTRTNLQISRQHIDYPTTLCQTERSSVARGGQVRWRRSHPATGPPLVVRLRRRPECRVVATSLFQADFRPIPDALVGRCARRMDLRPWPTGSAGRFGLLPKRHMCAGWCENLTNAKRLVDMARAGCYFYNRGSAKTISPRPGAPDSAARIETTTRKGPDRPDGETRMDAIIYGQLI